MEKKVKFIQFAEAVNLGKKYRQSTTYNPVLHPDLEVELVNSFIEIKQKDNKEGVLVPLSNVRFITVEDKDDRLQKTTGGNSKKVLSSN